MKFTISTLAVVAVASHAVTAEARGSSLSTTSAAGRHLMENAERVLDENQNGDFEFIMDYSIKFQGCHHVQQWNENANQDGDENEDDVKIMTKRLARFRLCPSDSCSNERSAGCSTKFGDYIVDMDTFVEAYLAAMEDEKEELCTEDLADECANQCANDDANYADCMATCYETYDLAFCYEEMNNDNNDEDFDAANYAACQEYEMPQNDNNNRQMRELEEDAVDYFIGAFCADQGGEIHLGLFTDDTCTTFASNGYSMFQAATGYTMPYSETSLVTTRCLTCGADNDGDGNIESKEVCENTYAMAGKCETRMNIDYRNENSCNYIEGIKIIREDGVIRTSATKKSKAAAVAIGLFSTMSVLLAAYVYYLRTKLARAQINLAASSQPLT